MHKKKKTQALVESTSFHNNFCIHNAILMVNPTKIGEDIKKLPGDFTGDSYKW